MNLLANGTSAVSAQMRGYRSQAAQTLLGLLRPGDVINDIGWEQLERLPAWTLLKTQDLLSVTREIGMVVLAPALKKSIDGTLHKTVSGKVDASFLRRLLSSDSVDDAAGFYKDVEHFQKYPVKAIEQAGASVLLSTIDNTTLADILARRFEGSHEMIDAELATNLVEQAEELKAPSLTNIDQVSQVNDATSATDDAPVSTQISSPATSQVNKRRTGRTVKRARAVSA